MSAFPVKSHLLPFGMGTNCEVIVFPPGKTGKIVKWKVKEGTFVSIGRVLLLYDIKSSNGKEELKKLKATQIGIVRKLLTREGETITPGTELLELEECTHPTVMNAMCAECGADLKTENQNCLKASVPMVHSIPELKVSREQAEIIGKADEERLLKHRKLVLLVDLDQTLIHTTNDNIPPNIKDVYHFQLYGPTSPWYHTRIRPGTQHFLKEMSQLYELHICTFGARNYAHMIATFLDQDGKYFSHRILSRDECFNSSSKTANLSALFPCGDNLVCIIDDREDVWNFSPNLIHVKPYHFFRHTGDINAPPGLAKHENDEKEGFDFSLFDNRNSSQDKSCQEKTKDETEKKMQSSKIVENSTKENNENKNSEEKGNTEATEPTEMKEIIELKGNTKATKPTEMKEFVESKGNTEATEPTEMKDNVEVNKISDLEEKLKENTELKEKLECLENSNLKERFKTTLITELKEMSESIENHELKEKPESIEKLELKEKSEPTENNDLKEESESVENTNLKENTEEAMTTDYDKTVEKEKHAIDVRKGSIDNQETDNERRIENVDSLCTNSIVSKEEPSTENCLDTEKQSNGTESKSLLGFSVSLDKKSNCVKLENNISSSTCLNEIEREIEDSDDYLLYLEEILKTIHHAFYELYDELQGDIPDLKSVIPYVRRKVLSGTRLVFSGLVPTTIPLEKSRVYQVARSLGAVVAPDIDSKTTHLVAIRSGTAKVNTARRMKTIAIVTPEWLWGCAERWEHIEEKLFPLGRGQLSSRHPPLHCGSPEHIPGQLPPGASRFMDSINPLMSFSSEDIANMDREVEDIFNESESEGEREVDRKGEPKSIESVEKREIEEKQEEEEEEAVRRAVLDYDSSSSSADSLSGEHPHGWRTSETGRRKRTVTDSEIDDLDEDMPSTKFRRGEALPSDLELGEDDSQSNGSDEPPDEIDDGDWNMMGAALEREFLSGDRD